MDAASVEGTFLILTPNDGAFERFIVLHSDQDKKQCKSVENKPNRSLISTFLNDEGDLQTIATQA